MKRLFLLPVLLLSLAVAGCAALDPSGTSILSGGTSIVAPITNPVSTTNLYQAQVVFAGSQEVVLKYQEDCFGGQLPPYPVTLAKIRADSVLAVQCKHRVSRYNAMKVAEDRASDAIFIADNFIKRNPTGNAVSYIAAAWKAVNDYKARAGG